MRSFGYSIATPTTFLNLHHFLHPITDCTDQSIYLRLGVISMKRQPDSTLAFWDCWVFHGKGAKSGGVKVEDKPIAVSLAGPYGDNMGEERLLFPAFAERNREYSELRSFLPGRIRGY